VPLGRHVERCQDCGHSRISYNSCRNRHCPKCQGVTANDWLAAREADLLPVGYFDLVFTLPAEIAPSPIKCLVFVNNTWAGLDSYSRRAPASPHFQKQFLNLSQVCEIDKMLFFSQEKFHTLKA
jgi:hypothetical protein